MGGLSAPNVGERFLFCYFGITNSAKGGIVSRLQCSPDAVPLPHFSGYQSSDSSADSCPAAYTHDLYCVEVYWWRMCLVLMSEW